MENEIIEIIEKVSGYMDLKNNKNIDLLETNILDSLAFIDLITELEEHFDIEIQPTEISPDTWRNLNSICNLVSKLHKNQI